MRGSEKTLNAWDSQFWLHVPLPLAEVGTRLQAAQADYLSSLLRLAEDAVALAGAMGLARATARGVHVPREILHRSLVQPSLGKRVELLRWLEAHAPGVTGWSLGAEAPDARELIVSVNPGSVPRRVGILDVFDALAKLRNDVAHRRAHGRVEPEAERAILGLIARNTAFREPLVHVTEVRVDERGERMLKATSLNGPAASSYRRGHWQPTLPDVVPGRVGIGEPRAVISAHPFLVYEEGSVYVLDEIRRDVPVLRSFATRAERRGAALPVGDPEISVAPARTPERPRTLPLLPIFAPAGCLGAVALACVTLALLGLEGTEAKTASPPPSLDPVPSRLMARECPAAAAPRADLGNRLAYELSGIPMVWGQAAGVAEEACGALPSYPLDACASRFADLREVRTPAPWRVPLERDTTIAFHHQRGLFEVMVYSDAPAAELRAFVESRLGRAHGIEGSNHTWDYALDEDTVRLKVSPLRAGHSLGRSAIKAHVLGVSLAYRGERATCPD